MTRPTLWIELYKYRRSAIGIHAVEITNIWGIPAIYFHPRTHIRMVPLNFKNRAWKLIRSQIAIQSRARIQALHPDLAGLAETGTLVLIEKEMFGSVPTWRTQFVEPEQIWLVGTNHMSRDSAVDVDRVVRSLRPDNVVVELCRSRQGLGSCICTYAVLFKAGIMYISDEGEPSPRLKSNMFSLSGAGFFGAVGRSINLGGQTALALRLLLAFFSSKVSLDANRPFGDEFRAARKASEEVGAQLVLGDRPIEITLERAWNSLTWNEKSNLKVNIFTNVQSNLELWLVVPIPASDQAMEDNSFQLYERLSISFPSLLLPLIHERDVYLAWSLKRSKAVNNCKKVVGVIGKGHMNGVIYALVSDLGELRFRDLVGTRSSNAHSNNGWMTSLAKNLFRDTVIGFLLWSLYEQVQNGL
ncbi:hypothetical protein Syun_012942 [Stephania yunnanensis]|uniref:TraB domain-containing protein n=1 Tax=Stephania yunnanensis TaxID=152371 RepID=A0AAP0PGV3_9MAGN